jgi:predicted nucleic acid-binding protein
MSNDLFLDTSGIYAYLVRQDVWHKHAASLIQETLNVEGCLVTTDYIIDELATLIKMRGCGHDLPKIFDGLLSSQACRIDWMDRELFEQTKTMFLKYIDHQWSFTDCFSFIVMKNHRIDKALSNDAHFLEAGFIPLLKEK